LTDERSSFTSKLQKDIDNLKYDLESKNNQLEQFQAEISKIKETLKVSHSQLDATKKENCSLQNLLRDLETYNSNLQNNSEELSKYIDQSKVIDDLERDNRRLCSELEFLRANKEENIFYKEELESKVKQIERYQAKIVTAELEISVTIFVN